MHILDNDKTIYKPIPKYEHLVITRDGVLFDTEKQKKIIPISGSNGYVELLHGVKGLTVLRHRLVAMAWLGLPEGWEKLDVNHLDGIPGNDDYSNLEWATRSRNIEHAIDLGLIPTTTIYVLKDGKVSKLLGYSRASTFTDIPAKTLSNRLAHVRVYYRNDFAISLNADELLQWEPTREELFRYGLIRIYKDDKLLVTGGSLNDVALLRKINLTRDKLMRRLQRNGSKITAELELKVYLNSEEFEITPWTEEPKSEKETYYFYDLMSGKEYEFIHLKEARRVLGVIPETIKRKLLENDVSTIKPHFKVSKTKQVWETKITFEEMRHLSDKVIIKYRDDELLVTDSAKKIRPMIREIGLYNLLSLLRYPEKLLFKFRRKSYDLEYEIKGVRYGIDESFHCYIKSQV